MKSRQKKFIYLSVAYQNRKDLTNTSGTLALIISTIQAKVIIDQPLTNVSPGVWKIPSGQVFGTMINIYDAGGALIYGTNYTFAGGTTATFVNGPTGTPWADYVLQ